MKYRLSEIAAVCGGVFTGRDREVGRVIVDSRTFPVDGETLFVAIRTANRDGADYIGELYARGVRGFIVGNNHPVSRICDCPRYRSPGGLPGIFSTPARFARKGYAPSTGGEPANAQYPEAGFVVVADTVAALQALAAHYRAGFTGKVVGITGSYGKTTVKEWIAQLAPSGVTLFRSPKSWNSQIGVPLSVLAAGGDEDYIVIEAGVSEPEEMRALQRIIRPDIGILTSVGGAHEENFASREQLRDEKMVLFRDCPDVLYGEGDDFNRRNKDLAVAFWRHEGYDISNEAVAALEPVAMRLEVREGLYNSVIINDTYNSDIASLAIALDYLARVAAGRPRIVIMPGKTTPSVVPTATPPREGNNHPAPAGHPSTGGEPGTATELVRASGVERLMEITPDFTVDDAIRSLSSTDIAGRAILIKGGARLGFERISRALERRSHTTVLEVDLDAIIHNLALCRSRLTTGGGEVGVMPMIKANGYGHGTFEVARTLQGQGVDYLAVAFADEGVALREGGITMPIVVLNADAGSFEPMIRHRLEPEIYNFASLGEFVSLLKRHGEHRYPIHIKLDTGMHRLGFREEELSALTAALADAERYARVATIFSHLAAADDPAEDDFTRRQIASFDRMSRAVAGTLPYPVRRHLANTKGVERFPEAHFDMVRLGIGLYGIGMEGAHLAASLKTRIVNIAPLDAGETVGYNRRGVLSRPSLIATIPTGYADGLNRRLSGGAWSVLVGGVSVPIVGNVCMDSCMIDVTDIPGVGVGDEVTIFSASPGNTVEDMAAVLGTIPYEVMTSVSGRVKRIYTKE